MQNPPKFDEHVAALRLAGAPPYRVQLPDETWVVVYDPDDEEQYPRFGAPLEGLDVPLPIERTGGARVVHIRQMMPGEESLPVMGPADTMSAETVPNGDDDDRGDATPATPPFRIHGGGAGWITYWDPTVPDQQHRFGDARDGETISQHADWKLSFRRAREGEDWLPVADEFGMLPPDVVEDTPLVIEGPAAEDLEAELDYSIGTAFDRAVSFLGVGPSFDMGSLSADVRDAIMEPIRTLPKTWAALSRGQQAETAFRINETARDLVYRLARLIAGANLKSMTATVDNVTVKEDEIVAKLTLARDDPMRHALTDLAGKQIVIVLDDHDQWLSDRNYQHLRAPEPPPPPAEPELPLGDTPSATPAAG